MKNILITGGGSGLGAALAKKYSQQNYRVILVGRRKDKLDSIVESIHVSGGQAKAYVCDITELRAIKDLYKRVETDFKEIDMLINCAGVGYFGPLETLKETEIQAMFAVNTFGTIYMTQTFLPMVTHRVMNIISTAGLKGKVNESVYVASKYAVRGFTESLQKEYQETALIFTAVYMGGMDTPFWTDSHHIKDKSRLKSPDEVADLIVQAPDDIMELKL